MDLETHIRRKLKSKPLLLMTHIVVGYPSFRESWAMAKTMIDAGVDLMELQIPFSEPMADGPIILHANQKALEAGATLQKCFEFARELGELCSQGPVPIPLLFMSYYNLVFKHGVQRFAADAKAVGMAGAIVPDLPPEEGGEYLAAMQAENLSPIALFAPNTPDERMRTIAERSSGLVYCVARKGVTGAKTDFSTELTSYLERARRATSLPLAVGFGLKERKDIDFVRGKADVAIVGSRSLEVLNESGLRALGDFMRRLTEPARVA
jgi:tryptophan synthase alpha chain